MMLILQKIIGAWLMPLPFCFTWLLLGWIIHFLTGWRRWGYGLMLGGTALLMILSFRPVPVWLASRLENQYPPLLTLPPHTRWIVVLSGQVIANNQLSVVSQLTPVTLARLVEGIRLWRQEPQAILLVSGGALPGTTAAAIKMAATAEALGVPASHLQIDTSSRTTAEQAANLAKAVGQQPFVLVTSAIHMPRAIAWFKSQHLQPIAAPANYLTQQASTLNFLPSSNYLAMATASTHEYIGLLWSRAVALP